MPTVTLKTGRERSLLRRHPWVFSGAVSRIEGSPAPGQTVQVLDAQGAALGCGAWSPRSQIRVRMWSFNQKTVVDADYFRQRLKRSLDARQGLLGTGLNACRLVNAESDGLPGLIVDKYDQVLVCQFLSTGSEHWKATIVQQMAELTEPLSIYERSDDTVRRKEGLEPTSGLLYGLDPPELVEIQENGCCYLVDVRHGHKTGFYLDQRDNRALVAAHAAGAEMLNAFAYSGGFGVAALKAGAAGVVNVDSSKGALELARANAAANGLGAEAFTCRKADVFTTLRELHASGGRFDTVVLDPPKFAASKDQVPRASRGYKDINRLAAGLLRPGGLLCTFSCSGLIEPALFQKIVADGVLDAGRKGSILMRLFQASCHPTALSFPEGTYLKGLLCRID